MKHKTKKMIPEKLIKKVAKKLDDQIKLKGVLELVDGPLFRIALNLLNDKFSHKIPGAYQDEVILLLEAYVNDDYSKVTDETVEIINGLIDIPALNEDQEGIIVSGVIDMMKRLILSRK